MGRMPNSVAITLNSPEATFRLGRLFGELALSGDVISLEGDLGAGKTLLTQGIGKGLGVPDTCYITSPTFGLVHEYPGRLPLFHIDLYRLASEEEIEAAGIIDFLYESGVTVVEWAARLGFLMPAERLDVVLSITGATTRLADLVGHGAGWQARIQDLGNFS